MNKIDNFRYRIFLPPQLFRQCPAKLFIPRLAQQRKHILLVGFHAGLVKGIDGGHIAGDAAGHLEETDHGGEAFLISLRDLDDDVRHTAGNMRLAYRIEKAAAPFSFSGRAKLTGRGLRIDFETDAPPCVRTGGAMMNVWRLNGTVRDNTVSKCGY